MEKKKINFGKWYLILLVVNVILTFVEIKLNQIVSSGVINYGICSDGPCVSHNVVVFAERIRLLVSISELCYIIFGLAFFIVGIIYIINKFKEKVNLKTICISILVVLSFIVSPIIHIFVFIPILESDMSKWEELDHETVYKPMIYIYPTEDNTNVTIKLSDSKKITHSYPRYDGEWDVVVDKDGNVYDSKTDRNYYGLYWEGIDNSKIDTSEGFVIRGSDAIEFLEEKLEIIGLNEREINEFIVYWLPKLEDNKYNYIRFRTTDEINEYMKIDTNVEIDSLIRVYMDYKSLDKKIKVKEQKLIPVKRQGFTIVEWGGRELK